ncbi:hypothetical protein CVT25_015287 [Psilocybe cyanescens]|uniref:Hydrophobin n=1 Tax=Psilocybe cyanescens TaxID=93625 RepID=A0A409XR58_PSICY|nr:hypothetical protein CVT25_015287 [Psilocybe cyanescens]
MNAFSSIIVLALPFFVAATPLAARTDGPSCNTGSLQCCNKTTTANNAGTVSMLGALGIDNMLNGLVGLQCTPISAIAISGNNCQQETLCCTGNTYEGALIATGCTPINANL